MLEFEVKLVLASFNGQTLGFACECKTRGVNSWWVLEELRSVADSLVSSGTGF